MTDKANVEEQRPIAPLWRMGFRPFFLVGIGYGVFLILYWLGNLYQIWRMPDTLNSVTVHMHEMVYGFAVAILAGFLLTASSNWTQTRGLHGVGLIVLIGFWFLGRVGMWAVLFGAHPMWLWLDMAAVPGLMIAIGPNLIRARKWNNISVLFWLGLLVVGHVLFLLEISWLWMGWGRKGLYLGLHSVLFFLILIGGRVIPYFTGNYLRHLPIQKWVLMDRIALAVTTVYVGVFFVFDMSHHMTGMVALLAGISNALRMRYWHSWQTRHTPILWVLHLAYLWMVIGFFLHAATTQGWVPWSSYIHAFTTGGLGCFVLGMVSRVSLGHTGRPLQVSGAVVAAYVILQFTALIRVIIPVLPGSWFHHVISIPGMGWSVAFVLYLWVYFPILTGPRADGKDG